MKKIIKEISISEFEEISHICAQNGFLAINTCGELAIMQDTSADYTKLVFALIYILMQSNFPLLEKFEVCTKDIEIVHGNLVVYTDLKIYDYLDREK